MTRFYIMLLALMIVGWLFARLLNICMVTVIIRIRVVVKTVFIAYMMLRWLMNLFGSEVDVWLGVLG